MFTRRNLAMVAATTLLAALALTPASNASANQVTEYTIVTVTRGAGEAPVLFKDWAVNTRLLFRDGAEVPKGAWLPPSTLLRFQVDPAAQNGIWIDTDKAFMKFYPSDDGKTRCLTTASGTDCRYAAIAHQFQITTTTDQVREWTVENSRASVMPFVLTSWSANIAVLFPNGTPVGPYAVVAPGARVRVVLTDPNAQNGLWVRSGTAFTVKFWPSDDNKTDCIPTGPWCVYNQVRHSFELYVLRPPA